MFKVRQFKITLFIIFTVCALFAIFKTIAIAQVGFGFPPLWDYPSFSSQPLQVPTWEDPLNGEGDILVDNFEYWDSPYNHGWLQVELPYLDYGYQDTDVENGDVENAYPYFGSPYQTTFPYTTLPGAIIPYARFDYPTYVYGSPDFYLSWVLLQ